MTESAQSFFKYKIINGWNLWRLIMVPISLWLLRNRKTGGVFPKRQSTILFQFSLENHLQ